MTDLQENHKRTLLARFRHVDNLLSEMESAARGDRAHSPFYEYITDLTGNQKQAICDHCQRVRAAMVHFLAEKGIAMPPPFISTSQSIHTGINFADMAFEELKPKYLRGYGALSDQAKRELDDMLVELQGLLKQMHASF